MSGIFVEEENTVYELDEECLKQKKRKMEQRKESNAMKMQSTATNDRWILLVVLCCMRR